jgi:two-component system, cell cycle response regulator
MEDVRKWYTGSLPASIDALKAARKSLNQGPATVDSIRRIAKSLGQAAKTYGFPGLGESSRSVEESPQVEMGMRLDQLLQELGRISAAGAHTDVPGILVIENDPNMARLLEQILAGSDREVLLAKTGEEATRILAEKTASLVVLDLSLPDTDGRNILMNLRERASTASVPVIVLSGLGGTLPKAECYALGADAFFEKPIAPDVLRAAISSRLHRSLENRREARQDNLSGLPNRAGFIENFKRYSSLAARRREPLTMALLNCDRLKVINETYGPVAGDAVLRHAARCLARWLRRSDLMARWDGDEFTLLFPGTTLDGACRAVDKVLHMFAQEKFRTSDGRPIPISFSAGIISVPPDAKIEEAMAEADRFLYLAKANGRGRWMSATDWVQPPTEKVLLAADDPHITDLVTQSLQREGVQVVHCPDANTALQAALNMSFKLCILDLHKNGAMTHGGGSLVGELRRASGAHPMPLLMLTSLGHDQDLAVGFELGADDYLVKPFSPFDLMTHVRHLMRR